MPPLSDAAERLAAAIERTVRQFLRTPGARAGGPPFALALAYDCQSPLPPLLALLTTAERDAVHAASSDVFDVWNPAEYAFYDIPELDLDDKDVPRLRGADMAEQEAEARDLLNRVATRLNACEWAPEAETDLIVYATDLEGVHLRRNMAVSLRPSRLAALEADGLL